MTYWTQSEVIAYLEDKIICGEATDKEVEIYNIGVYGGELTKSELGKLIHNMNVEYSF